MRKPRPIKARCGKGDKLTIEVVAYRDKTSRPYLYVESSGPAYGYIEDRDIKRLKAWCDDALRKRAKE